VAVFVLATGNINSTNYKGTIKGDRILILKGSKNIFVSWIF